MNARKINRLSATELLELLEEQRFEEDVQVINNPVIGQFGITQEQVDDINTRRNYINSLKDRAPGYVFVVVAILIIVTIFIRLLMGNGLFTSLYIGNIFSTIFLLVISLAGTIVGAAILTLYLTSILKLIIGIYGWFYVNQKRAKRVDDYDAAVELYGRYLKKLEKEQIRIKQDYWMKLSGRAFENEMAKLYRKLGFDALLKGGGGDGGVDIILKKDSKTIIVQCKAHKSPVGPHVVRDLHGTLIHYGANEAILASVSGFTVGVESYVKGKPITLLGLDEILEMQCQVMSKYDNNNNGP